MKQESIKIEKLHHFINGRKSPGNSERFADVHNPALGTVVKQVPLAGCDDVRQAIASVWDATPAGRRAQMLFSF